MHARIEDLLRGVPMLREGGLGGQLVNAAAEFLIVIFPEHSLVGRGLQLPQLLLDHLQPLECFMSRLTMDDLRHRSLVLQQNEHERDDKDRTKEAEGSKELRNTERHS